MLPTQLSNLRHKIKRRTSFLISRLHLKKIDHHVIPNNPDEVRLFTMMRNEALRLPYFLDYYFNKGVDRIFIIDNGSTDDSLSIALQRDNVHVFRTFESFKNYSNWLEILLDKYGINHWCVAVDLDEIFFYPYAETKSIKDLIHSLEQKKDTAVRCVFLDMYSKQAIIKNTYKPHDNPLLTCPYFDSHIEKSEVYWTNQRTLKKYRVTRFLGNMRKRVFRTKVNLTKVPLFKYEKNTFVARGVHAIDGARISKIQGVVFHFKYLQDFNNRAIEEAERGEHEGGAISYKAYAKKVADNDKLNLYYKDSVKFENSQQLIKLKLMSIE